jgi:predicted chitinase
MEIIHETSSTITFRNVFPQETIGELTKKACLQGKSFKVSITVEEPYIEEEPVESRHPLADYLAQNHPFSGLSEKMNKVTSEIRESMSEKLFDKFAK